MQGAPWSGKAKTGDSIQWGSITGKEKKQNRCRRIGLRTRHYKDMKKFGNPVFSYVFDDVVAVRYHPESPTSTALPPEL